MGNERSVTRVADVADVVTAMSELEYSQMITLVLLPCTDGSTPSSGSF